MEIQFDCEVSTEALEHEIDSVWSSEPAALKLAPDWRTTATVRRSSGIGLSAIVISVAGKIAYDLWKKIILPRLEAKYGVKAVVKPVAQQDE